MQETFRRAAQLTSRALGSPVAFLVAALVVVGWAASGPLFHFSDTWQLFINTGTTVVTFLMVFLIQSTQNRDATIVQLKLDELIRAVKEARTELVDMESLSEEQLEALKRQFTKLGEKERGRPESSSERPDRL